MNPSRPDSVKKEQSLKTKSATSENCSICMEKLSTDICVQLLTCKHIYHLNCIHEWARERTDCPLCRINMWSGRSGFGETRIDGDTMARLVRFK